MIFLKKDNNIQCLTNSNFLKSPKNCNKLNSYPCGKKQTCDP